MIWFFGLFFAFSVKKKSEKKFIQKKIYKSVFGAKFQIKLKKKNDFAEIRIFAQYFKASKVEKIG